MREVNGFLLGDIVRTGFSAYFSNLAVFVPLSLVVFVPYFVAAGYFLPDLASLEEGFVGLDPNTVPEDPAAVLEMMRVVGVMMLLMWVNLICLFGLQAGLTYGVVRHLRGGPAGFAQTFFESMRRLLPVALIAIVVGIATVVGLVLLIVPGVIIGLMLWVAVPAAAVERNGLGALRRSCELTQGYKGQLLGLALLLGVCNYVALSLVDLGATLLFDDVWLYPIVNQFAFILTSGIWASIVAVTYHDLRVIKEGVDTNAIARVFE